MTKIGTPENPLRVAVVGSGPAGFYVAEHLLGQDAVTVTVDMFERLPAPYGLVRFGVAPDHEKIKNVTRVFEKKVSSHTGFRFFGNTDIGVHLRLAELRPHYHAVCFASGAQSDRRMNIPGEDLERSHPATEFVAWYNGHPDYRDYQFDLTAERVAVVGVGNVAVDVARILCRTYDELKTTDIADYALEALRTSRVREVYMLGRRGPLQAAFTNPEVRELGQMPGADIAVRADEIALDPLSRAALELSDDRTLRKKMEILEGFVSAPSGDKPRRLTLRFLVSPVEIRDDGSGGVGGMRLVRNELVEGNGGRLQARATEDFEDLPVDLVFRSVGYRGLPIDGLPFHDRWAVVPNDAGRVLDGEGGTPLPGLYVSGWIKRGPTGVIGTNKPDAAETVQAMLEDLDADRIPAAAQPDPAAIAQLVAERQPHFVSQDDWSRLNELETANGKSHGRPRVKYTSVEDALRALGKLT